MAEPSLELLQGLIQQVLDQVKLIRDENKQFRRRVARVEQSAAQNDAEVQLEIDGLVERIEERLATARP